MQHLQNEIVHPTSPNIMSSVVCLSLDQSIALRDDSSVSIIDQMEITMFMALRERIPLSFRTTDDSGNLTELVYIEGIDFQRHQLTLRHMSTSSSSHHNYIRDEDSHLRHAHLLLAMR